MSAEGELETGPAVAVAVGGRSDGVAGDPNGEPYRSALQLALDDPVDPAVTADHVSEGHVVEARHDLAARQRVRPEAATRAEVLVGDHGDPDVEEHAARA